MKVTKKQLTSVIEEYLFEKKETKSAPTLVIKLEGATWDDEYPGVGNVEAFAKILFGNKGNAKTLKSFLKKEYDINLLKPAGDIHYDSDEPKNKTIKLFLKDDSGTDEYSLTVKSGIASQIQRHFVVQGNPKVKVSAEMRTTESNEAL